MSHCVVEEGISRELRLAHSRKERIGFCCQSEEKCGSDILVVYMCKIYVCDLKEQVLGVSARNENRAWLLEVDDTSEAVVDPIEKFESLFD